MTSIRIATKSHQMNLTFLNRFLYIYIFFLLIVIHTTSWDCSSLPKSLSMQSFTFVFFMLWFTFQLIGWLVAYISLVNKNGKLIRKILLEPRQLKFFLNFVFIKHTLTAVCDGFVLAKKKITNLYVFVLFANLHALYLIYRLGLGMDLHSYLFYKTHSTFHYETTKAQILKRAFSFLLILILTQSCTLWLWYLTVVLEQSKCWSSFDRHVLSYTSSERCYNSQLLFRNIERKLLHPLPFLCSFLSLTAALSAFHPLFFLSRFQLAFLVLHHLSSCLPLSWLSSPSGCFSSVSVQ